MRRLTLEFGAVMALALFGTGLASSVGQREAVVHAAESVPPLAYVGSQVCASCHKDEASHHQLAMAHATDKSVLGDFSGVTFEHYGVKSRFYRRDGKFFVETDGPDGKLAEFEINART